MHSIQLSGIFIYPIKSMGGIALTESAVERRGFRYDRRWMLVDATGNVLTQRTHPRMALIAVSITTDGLRCTAPASDPLTIPFVPSSDRSIMVTVWQSTCAAQLVSAAADAWFSAYLGSACQLVYMPATTARAVNPDYAKDGDIVSFADGFPFLLIGTASLVDLNQRLAQPLPMNRFRPNLVITGATAFAEDRWQTIRIGTLVFHIVKPCGRCVITTTDQATGAVSGPEPLRTLATYRTVNHNVLFGQNVLGPAGGTLHVGDVVTVATDGAGD